MLRSVITLAPVPAPLAHIAPLPALLVLLPVMVLLLAIRVLDTVPSTSTRMAEFALVVVLPLIVTLVSVSDVFTLLEVNRMASPLPPLLPLNVESAITPVASCRYKPLTLLPVLPATVTRSRLSVPNDVASAAPVVAPEFPVSTMSVNDSCERLCSAPPLPLLVAPTPLPPVRVMPEIASVFGLALNRTREALLPETVSRPGPGPVMVMSTDGVSSPLVSVMVRGMLMSKNAGSKVIVPPPQASAIAWRNEPVPASAVLATIGLVTQPATALGADGADIGGIIAWLLNALPTASAAMVSITTRRKRE